MKKTILFLFLFSSTLCHAQLSAGLKLNWNINKFIIHNTNPNNEFYNKGLYGLNSLTLSGGIIVKETFSKYTCFQSELIYNTVNTGFGKAEYYTNRDGDLTAAVNDFQVQTHYLEIPVFAKISFGNKVTFDIAAGFYAGYLLSAKQSTENGKLELPSDTVEYFGGYPQSITIDYPKQNVRKDYTSFNAGVLVGLGVTMYDKMVFEIRLNRGLIDINKDSAVKNYTLQGQFSVGWYMFRKNKKESL